METLTVSAETLGCVYEPQDGLVQTEVWKRILKDGVDTGCIRRVAGRPVGAIYADLYKKITRLVDEYAALGHSFKYLPGGMGHTVECPKYHRISTYAVTGGSEGHYVYVDLQVDDGQGNLKIVNLMMVKTFKGMKHARRIAARLGDLLGV